MSTITITSKYFLFEGGGYRGWLLFEEIRYFVSPLKVEHFDFHFKIKSRELNF